MIASKEVYMTEIISNSVLFNRKQGAKRKLNCPLSSKDMKDIDYKNPKLLLDFISENIPLLKSLINSSTE